jgi:catechol 2,3-dioxygenase-like lactoylglutathione lyase family enzyme
MNLTYDHIHLRTPDHEGAAQWFAAHLGGEITGRITTGKPRVDVKLGGATILITQADASDIAAPDGLNKGIDHVGFAVQGLDAVVAELKAKGVVFTMEPNEARPGIRICFIKGPENISIELLERSAA